MLVECPKCGEVACSGPDGVYCNFCNYGKGEQDD